MRKHMIVLAIVLLLVPSILTLAAQQASAQAGEYFEVEYAASDTPGKLPYGVTYTVWIPSTEAKLRGVIVHQHGCGTGACQGGATAAYDLHWQALAAKWQCALLGPSYHQVDGQDCRQWCDPRNGSEETFLKGLADLGAKSKRPELSEVPWCLWGHSGGGFWASLMQTKHPERIVAIWFRSGTAFATWEKGDIPKPDIPAAAYQVPMMLNPGAKERDHERFKGAWDGSLAMLNAYRAQGAPVGFSPDPRTSHECGDSRYLAIPFFDACLSLRLPDVSDSTQTLKLIDKERGYLAPDIGAKAVPANQYADDLAKALWLPSAEVAIAWEQYVQIGATEDGTPPPAPSAVQVAKQSDGSVAIAWNCLADFESGLQQFIILRNGSEIGRVPEKPVGKFGRPLFQSMSYHDTPEKPLPEMRFVDPQATDNPSTDKAQYAVIAINSVGLQSTPTKSKD